MTILPAFIGAGITRAAGIAIDWPVFWTVLAGFAFIHLGTNVVNDYFDGEDGTDGANKTYLSPFSGGSRMLQEKRLTKNEVVGEGIILFAASAACFTFAAINSNPCILIPAAIGVASGIFYSAPPLKISRTGFGEALVMLNCGPVIASGAYMAQAGSFAWLPVIAGLPAGIMTAMFVVAAEFPDYEADKKTGRRNLVIRLGREKAGVFYIISWAAAYAVIAACAASGYVKKEMLWSFAALPVTAAAVVELWKNSTAPKKMGPACALAYASHFAANGLLAMFMFL